MIRVAEPFVISTQSRQRKGTQVSLNWITVRSSLSVKMATRLSGFMDKLVMLFTVSESPSCPSPPPSEKAFYYLNKTKPASYIDWIKLLIKLVCVFLISLLSLLFYSYKFLYVLLDEWRWKLECAIDSSIRNKNKSWKFTSSGASKPSISQFCNSW